MGHPKVVKEVFVNGFYALSNSYPVVNPFVAKHHVHMEGVGLMVDVEDVHKLQGKVHLKKLISISREILKSTAIEKIILKCERFWIVRFTSTGFSSSVGGKSILL